jgi:hypothetical protein
MMGAGKVLAFLGGLLTLVGTYVFAIYGVGGYVASGIGFFLNLFGAGVAIPGLFEGASGYAALIGVDVIVYWVLLILFIVFLISGILQFVGVKSRAVAFIFSLFPLVVGVMLILVFFTTILGPISGFFTLTFIGEQYGSIFPFMINLGNYVGVDVGLGGFIILAGGLLGLISAFLKRED